MARDGKQQYVDTVMTMQLKATFATLSLLVLGLASPDAFADSAAAHNTATESRTAATRQGETVSPEQNGAKQSGKSETNAKDPGFVDKDGDGIHDGKEHRFRRRSQRHKEGDRHSGKKRRNKARNGKGNGS